MCNFSVSRCFQKVLNNFWYEQKVLQKNKPTPGRHRDYFSFFAMVAVYYVGKNTFSSISNDHGNLIRDCIL